MFIFSLILQEAKLYHRGLFVEILSISGKFHVVNFLFIAEVAIYFDILISPRTLLVSRSMELEQQNASASSFPLLCADVQGQVWVCAHTFENNNMTSSSSISLCGRN